MKAFHTIVIGGGVAGLLTALRLSQNGKRVIVVEKDKIGAGATLANQGMIHSGAQYVRRHGHIVRQCQEAQEAFLTLVPTAEVPTQEAAYLADYENAKELATQLEAYGLPFRRASVDEITEAKASSMPEYEVFLTKERVFTSRTILREVLAACLANGVTILVGTTVRGLRYGEGRVKGISIGLDQSIDGENVVLAMGLGMEKFLGSFNSYYCNFFASRLTTMAYLPHASIERSVVVTELGKPSLTPAAKGVLCALFGDVQPIVHDDRKFPVNLMKSQELISSINTYFDQEAVNTQDAVLYTCGKTDYVGNSTFFKGRVGRSIDPGYKVIDHAERDDISGLYSVLPGKMTLAFHASKEVAEHILGAGVDLIIQEKRRADVPESMLAVEPWANL